MFSFVSSPLFTVMIVLIVAAIVSVSLLFALKVRSSITRLDGYSPAASSKDSAYITGISQTSWYINNLPVLELQVAVFPANGPMETAKSKQAFTYVDIPKLAPGALVYVTYGRDKKGAIKGLRVEGLRPIEWSGDPEAVLAVNELVQALQAINLLAAQGTILSTTESGALVNGVPVYKYHVTFQTPQGQRIEGDTYQAARPWLKDYRAANPGVPVQYSAADPEKFALGKQ